jgi:hypothetical protein
MRKAENKSGKVRHSLRRQSPALTTITFDGVMNCCLLHWGQAPLTKIVARILLKYHLPDDNLNQQNQIDAEYFSKDHDWHVDHLDFASFVRENYIGETEMEDATKWLAQAVASGVDIWKVDDILTQNNSEAAKL